MPLQKIFPEKLGQFILQERDRLFPSRAAFADKVGLDSSTIGSIESGKTESPGLEAIVAIADGLKISPMRLIAIYTGKDPEADTEAQDSSIVIQEIINVLLRTVPHRLFAEAMINHDGVDKVRELLKEAMERRNRKQND